MVVNIHAVEHQNERAFQRQHKLALNSKKVLRGGKPNRYVKEIGLGFVAPSSARDGTYVDKKCPWTGNVSIRGRILKGMVVSTKMKRTVIIRRHYLHYVSKYNRFEKRHKNLAVHCTPALEVKEGDIVTVGECRPLAKTVRFNVIKVEPKVIFGAAKKQFCLF